MIESNHYKHSCRSLMENISPICNLLSFCMSTKASTMPCLASACHHGNSVWQTLVKWVFNTSLLKSLSLWSLHTRSIDVSSENTEKTLTAKNKKRDLWHRKKCLTKGCTLNPMCVALTSFLIHSHGGCIVFTQKNVNLQLTRDELEMPTFLVTRYV